VTDDAFLRALETCALPETEFSHIAHVRAAYLYLRAHEFAEALMRIRASIRRYAARLQRLDRYHETITVAYLSLIQQRLVQRGDGGGWAGFAHENPDLLRSDLLKQYYSPAQLESELARCIFVLPDPTLALESVSQ
jgi:hypothetical protein